jgi:hypothetical protein
MRWQETEQEAAMKSGTESTEQRTVLSKDEARQAVTGQNGRYVLGFSLAGVIAAFVVIYIFYFGV